jgi:hypothetical protein
MKNTDTVTIYWAPFSYDTDSVSSWAQLYSDPVCLTDELRENKSKFSKSKNMFACPAITDLTNNVFIIKNNHEATFTLPMDDIKKVANSDELNNVYIKTDNLYALGITKVRPSSLNNYVNLNYNMQWGFFADEPVIARMTAPYMPVYSPGEGVILAAGQFDIGRWFRPLNLDYHVPFETKTLSFNMDDPLFYLEIMTDKKIKFQRYFLTKALSGLAMETVNSAQNYGPFKSLKQRYLKAEKASVTQQVLSEIKKNLV